MAKETLKRTLTKGTDLRYGNAYYRFVRKITSWLGLMTRWTDISKTVGQANLRKASD